MAVFKSYFKSDIWYHFRILLFVCVWHMSCVPWVTAASGVEALAIDGLLHFFNLKVSVYSTLALIQRVLANTPSCTGYQLVPEEAAEHLIWMVLYKLQFFTDTVYWQKIIEVFYCFVIFAAFMANLCIDLVCVVRCK